ncbi:MAG: hypothetical protein U9O94_05420 [Nanoarchaeota archaeon]|nr:hypothetical protein [Nanoarchaeota archaeon]
MGWIKRFLGKETDQILKKMWGKEHKANESMEELTKYYKELDGLLKFLYSTKIVNMIKQITLTEEDKVKLERIKVLVSDEDYVIKRFRKVIGSIKKEAEELEKRTL